MAGYETASNLIKEMERTLSINPKASIDTTLRKLQSVLRDNVNTTYGRRAQHADYLVNAGAPNLLAKLAGQALAPIAPRGIARVVAGQTVPAIASAIGAGSHGAGVGALAAGAAAAATLPFMSPRLVGEAAYHAGVGRRLTRPVTQAISPTIRPLRNVGRATSPFSTDGSNPYAP